MSKTFRGCFRWLKRAELTAGKVTVFALLSGAILATTTFAAYFEISVPLAQADNVNTAVTVLNTPPTWDTGFYAHEETASATTTPTAVVSARLAFRGKATDSSGDNYFLLICKTAAAPTATINAPPVCSGGMGNQWAISATTTSGVEAVAATTTREVATWATEKNDWYGWVCDSALIYPRCNTTYTNGEPSSASYPDDSSPFVINHPPAFMTVSNDSPKLPGTSVTWTVTATDTDHIRGIDQITLFVCRTASFSTSTGSGCNGGAWATSTPSSTDSVATSSPIVIPTQDKTYNAWVYIKDAYNLGATSTNQASASNFVVSNAMPSIDVSTISLVGTTTNLQLYQPASTSGPYRVQFIVTDNNSCQNSSSGQEISSATTSVYRSGVGAYACQTTTDFNTNRCYPSIDTRSYITCTQDTSGAITGNACSGSSDATVGWVCTFQLWFNADATVPNTTYSAQNWLAAVQVLDDNYATSSLSEATTGTELDQFLAFDVSQTSISYGGLQPGDQIDPLSTATSTDLKAQGNVGLDEYLYGDTMCPNWSNSADYCDHAWGALGLSSATSVITVSNQKFATDTVAYSAATALTSSSSATYFALQVQKTTATTSIQSKDTLWAIRVPATISRAGDYSGVNTIYAAISNFNYW